MSAALRAALLVWFALAVSSDADAQVREFNVASASPVFDKRTGTPAIGFRLTPESTRLFARLTEENVGHKLRVRVDGKVLMDAVIREAIVGGSGQVTVSSEQEAKDLSARLSDGRAVLEMEVVRD